MGIKGHTRPLYREATVEEYKKEPKIIEEMQKQIGVWKKGA